jgi:broad specificity phosphatase PhoE
MQTAQFLNAELQVPITYHDELKEVTFGMLNGTDYLDECKEHHKMLDYDWHPSGENVEEVKARVLKIVKEIRDESGDNEALVVAHGGIVRMLYFLETDGGILDEISNASLHSFDTDKILK